VTTPCAAGRIITHGVWEQLPPCPCLAETTLVVWRLESGERKRFTYSLCRPHLADLDQSGLLTNAGGNTAWTGN
jgi:hypothetical protein